MFTAWPVRSIFRSLRIRRSQVTVADWLIVQRCSGALPPSFTVPMPLIFPKVCSRARARLAPNLGRRRFAHRALCVPCDCDPVLRYPPVLLERFSFLCEWPVSSYRARPALGLRRRIWVPCACRNADKAPQMRPRHLRPISCSIFATIDQKAVVEESEGR